MGAGWLHRRVTKLFVSRSVLEWHATVGKSPVHEANSLCLSIPSSTIDVEFGVNLRGPPRKAKYTYVTDSERVP